MFCDSRVTADHTQSGKTQSVPPIYAMQYYTSGVPSSVRPAANGVTGDDITIGRGQRSPHGSVNTWLLRLPIQSGLTTRATYRLRAGHHPAEALPPLERGVNLCQAAVGASTCRSVLSNSLRATGISSIFVKGILLAAWLDYVTHLACRNSLSLIRVGVPGGNLVLGWVALATSGTRFLRWLVSRAPRPLDRGANVVVTSNSDKRRKPGGLQHSHPEAVWELARRGGL
ncbi:hypothetical protein R1flu_015205 [Riccia fluitans]|uniref:Uncharacterized protein n=1 Tax=Riccia fluitans TaxID=41844 RepID=A0ABD1YLI6_9MARC